MKMRKTLTIRNAMVAVAVVALILAVRNDFYHRPHRDFLRSLATHHRQLADELDNEKIRSLENAKNGVAYDQEARVSRLTRLLLINHHETYDGWESEAKELGDKSAYLRRTAVGLDAEQRKVEQHLIFP